MRVAVGMSGGVDSSVCAALLLEAGHEVVGVTLLLSDDPSVPGEGAVERARSVCGTLGVEHLVYDARALFESAVAGYFARELEAARTPNPCVRCNADVKFRALFDVAAQLGCDACATGHYARIQARPEGGARLMRGAARGRDQSYFLYRLTTEELGRVLFPLGDLDKPQVRSIASHRGLASAGTGDSQDVCFIDEGGIGAFLARRGSCALTRGPFVYDGRGVVGEHAGYGLYTVGQRKGLGVALGHPVYVTGVDPENALVRLGERDELVVSRFRVGNPVFHTMPAPGERMEVELQVRYRMEPVPAFVSWSDGEDAPETLEVCVPTGLEGGVAPGQSAVFYRGQEVLGGGEIC